VEHRITMSSIWILIISIGLVLFFYGMNTHHFLLEILGALSLFGGIFCGLSDIVIRMLRRKQGKRYK